MKHLTIILCLFCFSILHAQEPANIFGTGRGNLKLTSGVFTKTRPNGNLIAAFPAYFTKDSVDKYINNYNDTTNKFTIDCVDSVWRVGFIVKHRNWKCDIQEFTLDTNQLSGCAGGRVYQKTNLADTSMLVPSPVCGDILVLTLDTCKQYLYIRGTAPTRWNYIGAYLTNSNCFDPLPCKDSLWRVNDKVYHRNVDCLTQLVLLGRDTFTNNFTISGDTFRIFRNDGTIFTQLYYPGVGILDSLVTLTANSTNYKFTIGPNRLVSSIEFVAGDKIKFEEGLTGKFGSMKISSDAKDTLRTTTANSSTFVVTHSPARTTDFTLRAGTGVKFDSPSAGSGSAHGEITISADTSSTIYDGLANQKITSNLVAANNVSLALTPQSGSDKTSIVGAGITTVTQSPGSASTNGTITITSTEADGDSLNEIQTLNTLTSSNVSFKVELKKDASTNFELIAGIGTYFGANETGATGKASINVDTTNAIFNNFNYTMANVGSGSGVYKNTTSSDPKIFNLKSLVAGTGITITPNTDDITISTTVPTTERDSFWTHSVSSTTIVSRHSNIAGNGTTQTLTAGDRMIFSAGSTGPSGGTTIDFNGIAINATPSLAFEQDILSGNGKTGTPLTVSNCGVDYPNASTLSKYVMIQNNGAYDCLVKCPTAIDCTAQLNSIEDGSKLASVQDANDMNGLFTALIDVINRQGQKIATLENPQTFASAGTVNVTTRIYDQQKTIDKQAKLIEELTARLDRIDRLTASK